MTQVVNYLPPEPGTPRARRERVISHLTVSRPRGQEHFDAAYDLHCFDRDQWERVVRRGGWRRIEGCDGAGRPRAGRLLPYQFEVLRRV